MIKKMNLIYLCEPTRSHFASSRILDVLKGLRADGHNMIVGSGSSMRDYVAKEGFEFFDNGLNPVINQEEHESIDERNAIQMSENYLNPQNNIKAYWRTKKLLQKEKFDMMLSDNLCSIVPWLSEKLGMPYAVMSFQKFVLSPPVAKLFEASVKNYLQGVRDFVREENLHTPLPSSQSPVGITPSRDLNIIFSSPNFEGELVENAKYVGGVRIDKTPGYRKGLEGKLHYANGKNAYYSPGTIFWDQAQLKEVIGLARSHEINLFISEGKLFKVREEVPANVRVYDWITPSELDKLIPEMDLVIAQGGLGLTTRSIRSGVPLLVAPVMPGNFPQAVKVGRYGNGISLFMNDINMNSAFEEILYQNPARYKSKVVQLRNEFDQLGGSSKAVELIKELAYSHSS